MKLKLKTPANPVSSSQVPEPPQHATGSEDFMTTGPFLSISEAAAWLCVSVSTVKRMLTRGDIQAVRVGKRRKVPAETLAAHVSKNILIPEHDKDVSSQ